MGTLGIEAHRGLAEVLVARVSEFIFSSSAEMATLSTEDLYAIADFCLVPVGTNEPSVAEYVAECVRVLEKTGLTYKMTPNQMHGYGTNLGMWLPNYLYSTKNPDAPLIEGPWSAVMKAIHDCHAAVHVKGAPRIATDIRIGTRVDRKIEPGTGNEHKVRRVEEIIARDAKA
ncbi:uncharacterized protein FIBRA_02015 [Fibroporia radiculosa]|uniref:Thiamine-binding protein domain-containing protein n=1 Tax=Fibroporia radiculosa TaxID=599839 RepID=J4GM45_9APHY|nr:uncharacterized protein FIBRA_02015 [Fibroporia radiculosa]CCL99990.1 predicted protein [Fibroporia radiculosa]